MQYMLSTLVAQCSCMPCLFLESVVKDEEKLRQVLPDAIGNTYFVSRNLL